MKNSCFEQQYFCLVFVPRATTSPPPPQFGPYSQTDSPTKYASQKMINSETGGFVQIFCGADAAASSHQRSQRYYDATVFAC